MKIDEIEFRVIEVPYRSPFRTSFGEEDKKHCIIATVRSEGVEWYGESVMDPLPAYREECVAGAHRLAYLGQLQEDDVAQRILRVIGNADGQRAVGFNAHPFVRFGIFQIW